MSEEQRFDEPTPTGGLDPRVGGLLAYLIGWISGLVMFFTQSNREVRFHAAQSFIVFGGLHLFLLLWTAVLDRSLGSGFVGRLFLAFSTRMLYGLIAALWGFLCIQGYTRTSFKIPGAGHLAERLLEHSGYRGRHVQTPEKD
jgi:uncharacterized membrane protein